jgi:hypothetical protein
MEENKDFNDLLVPAARTKRPNCKCIMTVIYAAGKDRGE